MSPSSAHIAGVGVSHGRVGLDDHTTVEAAIKALLDAGLTYSDVDHSIACLLDDGRRIPTSCFDTLGMKGAAVSMVDNNSGLFTGTQFIKSGQANCVLVVGIDREDATASSNIAAIGVVLVSDLILNSHAYLRDSAVSIAACCLTSRIHSRRSESFNDPRTNQTIVQTALRQANLVAKYMQIIEVRSSSDQIDRQALEGVKARHPQTPKSLRFNGVDGWIGLCSMVWQLRGWAHDKPVLQAKNCLLYTSNSGGSICVTILHRSDGRVAPAWKDVKDVREGRERLGYNPAEETRNVSREDLENVRATEEFTSDEMVKRLELSVKGGDRAALARL